MAYAVFPDRFVRRIDIIGDSWMENTRVEDSIPEGPPRRSLYLAPHATRAEEVPNPNAYVRNFSRGGLTFSRALERTEDQEEWARDPPRLTILQVGACSAYNTTLGDDANIRQAFINEIKDFVTEWTAVARRTELTPRARREFEDAMEVHKWLLIAIPCWSRGTTRGRTSQEVKRIKKNIHTALRNARTFLWTTYRMSVVFPHLENAQFIPRSVHLTSEYQEIWNNQVFRAASALVCEYCAWTTNSFVPEEHKRYLRNVCARPLPHN